MEVLATRQDGFQELLNRHSGILFRVARTYARQPDDQLDLVQEIKVNLWVAYPKFDDSRSFSTWMYRIALNTAISWTRKVGVRRHEPLEEESLVSLKAAEPDEDLETVYRLIDRLDPFNRALLLLYLDDLSHADIAQILGISAGNVATKISRLKQQLRNQINQEEQEWNSKN